VDGKRKGAPEDTRDANPVTEPQCDLLGFGKYCVPSLVDIVEAQSTPHVVGVHAPRGSGKTTLLRLTQRALEERGHETIFVDSLRCSRAENVGQALVTSIYSHLKTRIKIEAVTRELKETGTLSAEVLEHLSHMGDPRAEVEELFSMNSTLKDPFRERLASLLGQLLQEAKRFVAFVDDLDRCDAGAVKEIISAIKLQLNFPNSVFVISSSPDGAERGVLQGAREKQGESASAVIDGRSSIDEIVELAFPLPKPEREDLEGFVAGSAEALGLRGDYEGWRTHLTDTIVAVAGENPGSIKRLLSSIRLSFRMAELRGRGLEGTPKMKLVKACAMMLGLSESEQRALLKCPDLAWPEAVATEESQSTGGEPNAPSQPATGEARPQWGNRIRNRLFVRLLWRLEPRVESIEEFTELLGLVSGSVGLKSTLSDERELRDLLRRDDERISEAITREIGGLGEGMDDYLCFFMYLLEDREEEATARANAASILGRLKPPRPSVVESLICALQDESVQVRISAAYALGHLGQYPQETIDSLMPALKDKNPANHAKAVAALREPERFAAEGKTILIYATQDKKPDVYSESGVAQGTEKPSAATGGTPPLPFHKEVSGVQEDDAEAAESRPTLAERISARLFGVTIEDKNTTEPSEEEVEALDGSVPDPVKTLITALRSGNSDVRMNAATDLGEFGQSAPPVVNALIKALNDGDGGVRWRASMALRKLGHASPEETMECLKTKLGKEKDMEARERIQSVINELVEN
jgi:HEAT repeat protein/energy-coupling factor transporter ATP-binding protein EcfA2